MTDLTSVFKKYSHLTFKDKVHIFIRKVTVPWGIIFSNIPSCDTIIDIGCGHGLFINLLSLHNAVFKKYIGIDKDPHKIDLAKQTENDRTFFHDVDFFDFRNHADVYSFFDVLYLIPYDIQDKLINNIFQKLPRNGYLVIKEIGPKPQWKAYINKLQETLSVKVLGITLGNKFYFRTEEEF